MKITELKRIVDLSQPRNAWSDAEVRIVVHSPGSIGAQPTVGVTFGQLGFDWDNGKFLIRPEVPLREVSAPDAKALKETFDKAGWNLYEISALKREVASLKKKLEKYENVG